MLPEPDFTLFFDGACPLCSREIEFLRRRDAEGRIHLVDIAAPDFDAVAHGRSREELMAKIQGRLPDGRWIEGMEVFRRAYGAVGLGWLMAPTAWPLLGRVFDAAYRWFARNRLRLTGRPACEEACALPASAPADAAERDRPVARSA